MKRFLVVLVGLVVVLAVIAVWEMRTSRLQAHYFSRIAGKLQARIGPGAADIFLASGAGPYDVRHGYHQLPDILDAFLERGFVIDSQTRQSPRFRALLADGFAPLYREKHRAGLRLEDRHGVLLFDGTYPARIYSAFESVPPLVWRTLLFVEDRGLLDAPSPHHNPAVNWPRLFRAATALGSRRLGGDGPTGGASTLATQIEKFRHWPEGRTESPADKFRQMWSASARAYLDGPVTLEARQRLVTTYLNAAPFGGIAGYGELTGLGDALWAWYGADFDEVNRLLREADDPAISLDPQTHGRAFRQVLHLLMAVQRPSYFLADSAGRAALIRRANGYLRLLEQEGIIAPALGRAAGEPVHPRARAPGEAGPSFVERKAVNAARSALLALGRIPALYQLDRLDALVRTGFDADLQEDVTRLLTRLADPDTLEALGLTAPRLLARGDPGRVSYAFVLHERTPEGNLVRAQADNVEAPFSPIAGAKLELGSTAKLRTLVTYLEVVERLHRELTDSTIPPPAAHEAPDDPLTRWVRAYLARYPAATLRETLDAAMTRRYSANPRERFFTGGGLHTFGNFESTHDQQELSVLEAFRHSVNLPFIRMMRDVVQFHMQRLPGHPVGALRDRDHPLRREYLERFADREGRQFLDQFLRKHRWTTRDEAVAALTADRTLSPARLAWALRSVARDATVEEFAARLADQGYLVPAGRAAELFLRADPESVPLVDRGFLAGVHPLELWLMEFRLRHAGASRAAVMDSSATVRQEVYRWLFATRRSAAQDQRIRSILEVEAFFEIHRAWQRLGYPFASLVPSYATAIGSSADRPDQLAELVGILLNDGIRMPTRRITHARLAPDTPWETVLRRTPGEGERVLSVEAAAVAREALIDVVEQGTGRRVAGAVRDADGRRLALGAKTGTGNNRFRVVGRGGRVIEDRAINRTATVVFFIGDRYYGTLTAFVGGAVADDYDFTSSLPVRILSLLGPSLSALEY